MSLHVKYRPAKFEDVIGQAAVVKSIARILKARSSQAFVLAGPSGCGKTTLARIAANVAGCDAGAIIEIDAATHTGIDAMRQIQEAILYKPLGGGSVKAVVIDEAHGLSRQSWESLLKVVEEPPPHAMWFFCTTRLDKVPLTIKTRCTTLSLKLVRDAELLSLVEEVADAEKMSIGDDVLALVVREARGSPRQALVNLAACDGCKNRKEAAELLRTALESDPTIELCRFLMKGGSWMKAQGLISKLDGMSPEGVRITIVNYMGAVLRNAKSDNEACRVLSIVEQFAAPYNDSEGLTPLFISVGRVLYMPA